MSQLLKRIGTTQTKFVIEIPSGQRIRIVSVTFNWSLGSGIAAGETATLSLSTQGLPLWQSVLPLQSAVGFGTFAVGLPAFALYELSFNPATGVLTYLPNISPGQTMPDLTLTVPSVTILWTNSATSVAQDICISYELDDI